MSCKEEKNVKSAPKEMMHGEHSSKLVPFKRINEEGPVQSDNRPNVPFHDEVDIQLGTPHSIQRKGMIGSGKDLSGKLTFGESQLSGYENPEKPQPELSPNMGFQPFGFPDGKFGSMHCTINHTFKSVGSSAPQPLFHPMRTYTRVSKRGSFGRSIDITRYSGYQQLKQDLARMFGIEGQLADCQRVGWQIVYVDHENDVVLVGGDPWEEFLSCVRSIRILSPQEMQEMSLDADSLSAIDPNRVCGTSNGIFSLANSGNGQNTAVARSRCMDTLTGISDLNTKRGCLPLLDPRWPNFQLVPFKRINEEGPVQSDNRPNVPFHDEVDIQLGTPHSVQRKGMMDSWKDLSGKLNFGESQLSGYENPEKPQPELSPNMGFQPFGFPDGKLGSIHCTINHTFKSVGSSAPQPLFHPMRTYTRVSKRGSFGRSIDITRYSGYQQLKQDLARMFGIEGQLADCQRVGWQIVYVDHENDVVLVGGDPWEEFLSCVRSISILSPQEIQEMSLDADSLSSIDPNRVCGTSNGIFSLANSGNGQTMAVAQSRCMDTLTGISDLNTKRECLPLLDSQWPNFQDGRRLKRPREQGMPDDDSSDDSDPDNLFKMEVPWLDDDISLKRKQTSPHLSLFRWSPQSSSLANLMRSNCWQASRSFVQNLAAADLSQQLDLPPPQFYPHNGLQFNAQLGQHPKSPAISQSSINQPKQELSSTSSSNISQFRKLLRKVTYNIESCSNNQLELLSDPGQDEEVQSHPRDKASFGAEIDIQLQLSMTPHSVGM